MIEQVKNYYGKTLTCKQDLLTKSCCSTEILPEYQKVLLGKIDQEILDRFYGCGSPIPPALEGATVLDLGCGTGRDAYMASQLVGENGFVIGIDMTEEQLDVARRHHDGQMQRFNIQKPNVDFRTGYIEDLAACGIADNSVDVVISNCVINLSPDKQRVFSEIIRVLKPGGELYFSDVFAGRRIPENVKNDPVLYGECLAGALYIEDFRRLLQGLGCPDYRVMKKRRIVLDNPAIEIKTGMIDFYSMTIRAFKLACLEDICEDYGQIAIYLGTIAERPHSFVLDDHHELETGKPMLVCGNTAAMVQETRFGRHFTVTGDRSTHFGPFPCCHAPAASGIDTTAGCC
jgi:SAM-dependent methyltransferase